MFFWIIQNIIISIILIMSIHYTYLYFKTNLTVPKIKDLIKKPKQQYKDIYESEEKTVDKDAMKNELKDYLKNLSKTSNATKLESVGDIFEGNDGKSSTFTSY